MTELDVSKTTTLDRGQKDYSVDSKSLDSPNNYSEEVTWEFPYTRKYQGYYKSIPELKKAVDALAIWTVGKGYDCDTHNKIITDDIRGYGKDTFQSILWNMVVLKKVIGDSFAEVIRERDGYGSDRIVNLKPISAERMKIVVGKNGIIKRYEQYIKNEKKTFKPEQIFHLCNDRIGDEIHGTSVVEACKWVIDARNEAMTDYRKVLHRNVIPVRIIEIDTDDTSKRNLLMAEYKDAINKGEVLVVPKGTVELKNDQITIENPITWIQSLENFFYQAVGIPRVIATSQDYTEAGSKIGYLTFEPIYTSEQSYLEKQLWAQLALKIEFRRPPSLKDDMQSSESKNTGQLGFQPKETGYVNEERE